MQTIKTLADLADAIETPEKDTAEWLSIHCWDEDCCQIASVSEDCVQIRCGDGGTIADIAITASTMTIDHDGHPIMLPREGWVEEMAAWLEADVIGPSWDDYARTAASGEEYAVTLSESDDGRWRINVSAPQSDRHTLHFGTRAEAVKAAQEWETTCESFADSLDEEAD